MLRRLKVENYALIDRLELELDDRLNIITGETGAGKSILLGALGLLLGNKNDNATLKDLCALMGGQLADEQGVSLTDKLNGKVPPSLLSKILRGQTHYKAAYTQCRLTIPGKVDISDSGKIGSRAGLPSLPDGQVWLCSGGGLTRRNGRTVTQVTYIGGEWDQEIYK